jgi:thiol:disulfide interchange protein DsbC
MYIKRKILSLALLTSLCGTTLVHADSKVSADPILETNKVSKIVNSDHVELRTQIKKYFNNKDVVSNIAETPIKNAYLVSLDDGTSFVFFKDSNYAILGDMYDLTNKSNITPELKADFYKTILNKYPVKNGIHYEPTVDKIGTAYVFTDPTCGYCRKLHFEMQTYLDKGIEVIYIPYPRSGLDGQGHDELVDVFNSGDDEGKKAAMSLAKQDRAQEIKSLPSYKDSPKGTELVNEGVQIGHELGIRGTPSIYLENGYNIPGYTDAESLAKTIIKQKELASNSTKKAQ